MPRLVGCDRQAHSAGMHDGLLALSSGKSHGRVNNSKYASAEYKDTHTYTFVNDITHAYVHLQISSSF